jgi:hypothetical protein
VKTLISFTQTCGGGLVRKLKYLKDGSVYAQVPGEYGIA